MKVSEQWLREWVDPEVDTDTLISQLTTAGLEVGGVQPAAGNFSGVVVGKIMDVQTHPNAERLTVCRINDGQSESLQVVCGAVNVRVGMKAPFAQVNAKLPGDITIRKTKIRGIESFGMLCSGPELGMADSTGGVVDLPSEAPTGAAVTDYLGLDDRIIKLDLTPNRGDCLGMLGVAREVAAINGMDFQEWHSPGVEALIEDTLLIELNTPEHCPVYTGRIVKDINPCAETPVWMRERLRRAGLRTISPVVDITNYVLLESGQPMHAFDLRKLTGSIRVRMAQSFEKLTLLDGREVELDDDVLVIADEKQALAMAGIMGGQYSAVSDQTQDVFLEAACFNPLTIAGKARRYDMYTDSSHRFERGVDPTLQMKAMERATGLLLEICGGLAGPVKQVSSQTDWLMRDEIPLTSEKIQKLLGVELSTKQIELYLSRLQISYTGGNGKWSAIAPSHRFDLNIEVDLIEEIARLYGYDNIPQTLPEVPQTMVAQPECQLTMDSLKNVMVERGWQEAITYSFIEPQLQEILSPDRPAVDLSNPLSNELSQMRTSHWTGLLTALRHNQNRQQRQIRLFEAGLNFIETPDGIDQQSWFSGIASGPYAEEHWSSDSRLIDFYDVKGDIEALFSHARTYHRLTFKADKHAALHPGQAAKIYHDENPVGWLGVLHPEAEKNLSIEGPVILFEIKGSALLDAAPRQFAPISRFPSIRRDLAIIVDEAVTSDEILAVIQQIEDKAIQKSWIFDIYRGREIEPGRKSVALGLIFSDYSSTLTDQAVETAISKIISSLAEKINAILRN